MGFAVTEPSLAALLLASPAAAQSTRRVSVDSSGVQGGSYTDFPSISADGQVVGFASDSRYLVPFDTNGLVDVFVHDDRIVGPRWELSGSCPGPVSLTILGATANDPVVIVCGPAGIDPMKDPVRAILAPWRRFFPVRSR